MRDIAHLSRPTGHQRAEAYCLMIYEGQVSGAQIRIWNSRDGVTPFCTYIEGEEFRHAHWRQDSYQRYHVPSVGDLIWVDLTLERAREHRRLFVDLNYEGMKDHPYFEGMSQDEMVERMAQDDTQQPGQPDLVRVTEEMHAEFKGAESAAEAGRKKLERDLERQRLRFELTMLETERDRLLQRMRELGGKGKRPKKTWPKSRKQKGRVSRG